ncbi:MAG TPA: sodium:solute symporter [Bacteroidetes bacterium]|nr:sodium/glucose cotransporter [bacterium BMS3Bbin03]HDK36366.1 sodium:solute symporter [Bacteroidota bacterium]
MNFTALDFLSLIVYLILVVALGSWFGRKQKDTKDYFLGGRNIPWYAVMLSVVATETSTLTFIGIPALAFTSDMTFLQLTFGYLIARIIVSFLFLPAYYRGEMLTAYELIDRRFGQKMRKYTTFVFMITRVLADGVRLFATAIPLKLATGFSYPTSIAIIGIVTLIYTYFGGIKAVVWMDVIQFFLYIGGALIAFFIILHLLPNGWSDVVSIAGPAGKFKIFNPAVSLSVPYTIWAGILGGTFLTMASHGTDQLMVQRLLSCRKLKDSQTALISSGFVIIIQFAFFLTIGVMLYAFYQKFPLVHPLGRSDEIFPRFIVTYLPHGVAGLVVASIFAAAMSSLSGSINSLASSSMWDIIKPALGKKLTAAKELFASRLITMAWGLLLIGMAVLAGNWGNVLVVGLTIASYTYGGMLGTFLLGLLSKRTDQWDAMIAMTIGLISILIVQTQHIAWPWFVPIGTFITYFAGQIVAGGRRVIVKNR